LGVIVVRTFGASAFAEVVGKFEPLFGVVGSGAVGEFGAMYFGL